MAALLPLVATFGAVLFMCGCAGEQSLQADAVMPDRLGKFNFEELESSIYTVALSAAPMVDEGEVKKEGNEETPVVDATGQPKTTAKGDNLLMIANRGQKFSCLVPNLQTDTPLSSDANSRDDSEKFPNVSEILLPLTERPCLFKTVGWWTYEYCHRSFVRQYHMEAGKVVGDTFYLGYYGNETVWTEERIKAVNETKKKLGSGEVNVHAYHSVYYVNGTDCDLTKIPRKTRVKVMCGISGVASLSEVKETDTCSYEIHVYTPLLCGVPYFKREQLEDIHVIKCSPLVSREKYEALLKEQRRQEAEADREKAALIKALGEKSDLLLPSSQKSGTGPRKAGTIPPDLVKDGHDRMMLLRRLVATISSGVVDEEDIVKELQRLNLKLRDFNNANLLQLLQEIEVESKSKEEQEEEGEEDEGKRVSGEEGALEMEGVLKADNELEEGAMAELEVDEETLSTLQSAVTDEVKQKLTELGLPTEGLEIKLDVTSLEVDDEDEGIERSEEEDDVAASDGSRSEKVSSDVSVPKEDKKKKEIKVIKLTVLSDSEESRKTAEQDMKDKEGMSDMEHSYNTLWENKEEESSKRKQSQL